MASGIEELRLGCESLAEYLCQHVVPIFREDGLGKQESHGTGVLLSGGANSFLVSAAHVFDPLTSGDNLFIYVGHKKIHNLAGSIRLTRSPSGKAGKADRSDIGVLPLLKAASPPYPEI